MIDDQRKLDGTGAYDWEELVDEDRDRPAEEYENPPGIARGECDTPEGAAQDESCDIEITAEVDDMFMEETKPGFGISGFEGEEDGGG